MVFRAGVNGHVTWLVVIAAINTVIGLAYYLRFAAQPFRGIGERDGPRPESMPVRRPVAVAIALAAAATIWLSVYPQPFLHAASTAEPLQAQPLIRIAG
jgi:NADH-quinone oxidoreductase subunit N